MASLFKKSVAAVMGLRAVWKSKFYGAFVLNLRVDLHAIMRRLLDGVAMPVRHRREMTW